MEKQFILELQQYLQSFISFPSTCFRVSINENFTPLILRFLTKIKDDLSSPIFAQWAELKHAQFMLIDTEILSKHVGSFFRFRDLVLEFSTSIEVPKEAIPMIIQDPVRIKHGKKFNQKLTLFSSQLS